jgi:hypothetical protein
MHQVKLRVRASSGKAILGTCLLRVMQRLLPVVACLAFAGGAVAGDYGTHPADPHRPGVAGASDPIDSAPGQGPAGQAIGPYPGEGYVRLPGHVLDSLKNAMLVDNDATAPASPGTSATSETVSLTLVLKHDDEAGFERYMAEVYNPQSVRYQHFLTPTQLTQRFGPSRKGYSQVVGYLRNHGFRLVAQSRNRMTLTVRGSRAAVERAFDTRIADYKIGNVVFFANRNDPALPERIAARIAGISGLSNLARPTNVSEKTPVGTTCLAIHSADLVLLTFTLTVEPQTIALIFLCPLIEMWEEALTATPGSGYTDPFGPLNPFGPGFGKFGSKGAGVTALSSKAMRPQALAGAGQTIGLLEFDGFYPSDISGYLNLFAGSGLTLGSAGNVSSVPVNGGVSAPGAGEGEVLLDIVTAMSIAPAAKVVVYEAPFGGSTTSYAAMFNAMINGGVTVISNSWASCEDQISLAEAQSIDAILKTAAASGISVFNGAGDSGNTCLDGSKGTIAMPADSPNATAVGGTSMIKGPGKTYGSETWWDGSNETVPTGQGGFGTSKFFARPSYQNGLNGAAMRSIPDVAINADPTYGVHICQADNGGCPSNFLNGGTSLAAPEWAAYAALLNQVMGHNLGNLNSLIYPLASTDAFHSAASMGSDFAHVGLGSPNLSVLGRLLANQAVGSVDANLSEAIALVQPAALQASGTSVAVPADGTAVGGVLVRLLDANGNTVSGKTVTLAKTAGAAVISPSSGVTTVNNGAVVFTVSDLTSETVTFTATDTTDGIQLSQTATLTFGVPTATAANLSAYPTSVAADGSSTTTITVTLKDSLGRATPGKQINISQGDGHSVITGPSPGVTDSKGQIQFTATDDVNETVTYTAADVSDANLPIPGTPAVTFGGAVASDCSSNPAIGASGYVVTIFASGFPAGDFFYSNINLSGCPGANNPYFDSSGSVLIPDFRSGDLYKIGSSGGGVTSGNVLSNLGESIGAPVYATSGNLYATRFATGGGFTTGDVIQIDPSTGAVMRELATGLTCPNSLVVDPLSGDLFFDDECNGGGSDNPSIWRISNPGGNNPTVSVYATLPVAGGQQQLAFAPNGTLYAVSGGAGNAHEVVQVAGTNTPSPATVTPLAGIVPDTNSIAIGQTNADGSAKTLLVHVAGNNGGSLETVDITTSTPTVATVLATGDIGAGVVGPDGCYYVGTHHVVYKLAPSSSVCTLTPSSPVAALTLAPASLTPNPAQGSAQTLTATLKNLSTLSGVPVLFQVSGANPQAKLVPADVNGHAAFTYTAINAGSDTVVAMATVTGTNSATATLVSNPAQLTWNAGTHVTFLALNESPTTAILNTGIGVVASLTDISASPAAAISGQTVSFTLGGSTCSATTGSDGRASCQLTPAQLGTSRLTATFAGTSQYAGANDATPFNVLAAPTPAPTATISVSPTTVAAGASATLTWSSTNATGCSASGSWSGTESTSGTLSVTPATNGIYTYTLTCTGSGGTSAATATLSATLVAVTVTAKSGGGALSWYAVLALGFLVMLRLRAALTGRVVPRATRLDTTGLVGASLLAVMLALAADSARADQSAPDQPASAADPFYVGIRVGSMPLRQDSSKIDQGLASLGFSGVTATSETSGTAGTVFLGYEFTPHTAVELGYTFRDSTTAYLSGTIPSKASLTPLLQDTAELTRGYGNIVSLSYSGRFEVLPRFSLEPRLGGFFWATKAVAISLDDRIDTTHEGGGVTAGLTAAYRIWRGLEVGVNVDHYRGFPNNIATLYGGSLEWRFGAP